MPEISIELKKGRPDQADYRQLRIAIPALTIVIILAGTVEHVSTILRLLMVEWMAQYPALVDELTSRIAACDFFDENLSIISNRPPATDN